MPDSGLSSVLRGPNRFHLDDSEMDTRSVKELEEEIAELCTHIDAATYRLLRAIAEFDRREAWGVGFPSTAHWLSWRVGIDLVTAREKVRVARALEGLPRISEAFRKGKVSYSKIRAITRIGSPDNEEYLLYIAENGTACHMEALVRAYRRACRGDDAQAARRQREERYLEMYTDDDGMVVIRGRLPQEIAALLDKALEAAMDALEEKGKKGETKDGVDLVEAGAERRKDASAESFRADGARMACDSAGEPEEPKSAGKGTPAEGSVRSSGGAAKDTSAESSGKDGQTIQADSVETFERSIFGLCHGRGDLSPATECAKTRDDSAEELAGPISIRSQGVPARAGEEAVGVRAGRGSAGFPAASRNERENDDSAESCTIAVIPVQTGIPRPHVTADPAHASAEASRADGAGMARDSAGQPEEPKPAENGTPAGGSVRASGGAAKDASAEASKRVETRVNNASAESCLPDGPAQRRADALGLLAEAALGRGLCRTERGEPFQVMIYIDAEVLSGRTGDGRCELEGGEGIPAETCRRLACDAPHATLVQDADGNILHLGRKARKISTPLWRALMSRDRTCRFPGCTRTRHLQVHHIEHWAKGGETNPENVVLLCRGHHWAVHEGGVSVDGRAPHGLVFRRPDGSVLPACPVPVPINGEAGETLKEANRRQGLDITADTVDSFWDGEPMDLHMAVDALLGCDDDPVDEE